jgi:hypothetical protein
MVITMTATTTIMIIIIKMMIDKEEMYSFRFFLFDNPMNNKDRLLINKIRCIDNPMVL